MGKTAVLSTLVLLASFTVLAQSANEFNTLGVEAYEAGRYEDAVGLFERAHNRQPENEIVTKNLANARMGAAQAQAKLGDYKSAERHLKQAITLTPDNYAPLVQLGAYYLQMNLVSDAIFRLEEAIEMKPGVIEAHELLGEAYYRDNDLPSARVQWDYVLGKEPDRPGLKERYDKAFREESVEQDFSRGGSRHFELTYPKEPRYASKRALVLRYLEDAYMEIGRKMGRVYPPSTIQVIMYSAEQFTEATQLAGHVGAVYDGKIRTPLTDEKGKFLTDTELKRRLDHEYVHVVVRHIAMDKVPWWVNEGLAEHLSRPFTVTEERMLHQALQKDKLIPMAELEGKQLDKLNAQQLRQAYAQAHAAVRYLWDKYGERRFNIFLAELADDMSVQDALLKQYRIKYEDLDAEVGKAST